MTDREQKSSEGKTEAPVVLISGAGGGLGRGLVAGFSKAGWRVAAAAHRCPCSEWQGADLWGCTLDVTDSGSWQQLVDGVVGRWGRLDLLVNNAGTVRDRLLVSLSDDDWDRVVDVCLKGAFLGCRSVLPVMSRQKHGHILNVASLAGRLGAAGQCNYASAKAGLLGLTLALAREVARDGIRVNAILPGLLPTPMTAALPASVLESLVGLNLLSRMNRMEEVVALTLQLAATRDVSGQIFQWDSRITAWA